MVATQLTKDVEQIDVINPVTSKIIGSIPQTPLTEVEDAVEKARTAQPAWFKLGVKERSRIIKRFGDLLWQDQDKLIDIIRKETGKNYSGAFIECYGVDSTVAYYTHYAARFLKPQGRKALFPVVQKARLYHKPRGVVGFITPWNYPLALVFLDVIPALIAGNAAVIKPSEITPFTTLHTVEKLYEAGVPKDVVQVVTGDGRVGAALVELVDYISFTGSTPVGKKVAIAAAARLIPYSLELGGKDSLIVLKGANLKLAAANVVAGSCENAGQMCLSVERVYVEAEIHDEFVEQVVQYASQMKVGSGDGQDVHMGSMVNERELNRVEEHIRDAVEKGAKIAFGGKRQPELGPLFFQPTVLTHVDHSMKVMTEETFGPVMPIMKVSNEDEAIRLANDTIYGLANTLFLNDIKHGYQLALRLDSGGVSINRASAVMGSLSMPWGGNKQSGIGRRYGPEGLLRFTVPLSIVSDNQFGMTPSLMLIDPFTARMLKLMRRVRRLFPFI